MAIVPFSVAVTPMSQMELSKKVKTALDETRMLILGAQILLGFELRAAFSDDFEKLPDLSRHLEALALMLMVTSVALMIAPGPYHRIVEGGRDSGSFHRVTTGIADLSLLPSARPGAVRLPAGDRADANLRDAARGFADGARAEPRAGRLGGDAADGPRRLPPDRLCRRG